MEIVKTDVPMTSALCHETVLALAERYPSIRAETITRTDFGRPVDLLMMGKGDRKVIFTAAHHANEWRYWKPAGRSSASRPRRW